jgi:ElaB/YqjD/DUF883 family membrane-anchored ribosome-binding protein
MSAPDDVAARVDALATKLRTLLTDAEELLHSDARIGRVREHIENACEEISGRAGAVNRSVHEHPWRAIAATGIVAFLLGLLVRRR